MLFPSVYRKNNIDNLFNDDFSSFFNFPFVQPSLMRTDVKETDTDYKLEVEMPGFKKDDIKMSLDNGYLSISAAVSEKENEEKEKGSYIRKERTQRCSRSFYVGDNLTEEDIKAKFENGILTVDIPKKEPKKIEEKKTIEIEG